MEVVLFRYRRGNSVMHKVPPLFKILFLMLFCIVTFAGGAYTTLYEILSTPVIIRSSLTFMVSIALFFLSNAKFTSLKCLRFVFVLGVAVTFFRMMHFQNGQQPLAKNIVMINATFGINVNGIASGILYTVRFFTTTLAAQIIFETTSSLQIKESMESIQNAVAKIVPPVKKINPALVISLAINFMPLIFETWNRVRLASLARSINKKKSVIRIIQTTFKELEALLSCLLYKAEIKRQAMLNRSCSE